MPLWVEDELNRIVASYSDKDIDSLDFSSLRNELAQLGLADLVPQAIGKIVDQHSD